MSDLNTPIASVRVGVTDHDGQNLSEEVSITALDFALNDIQAAAFLEEVNPDLFAQFVGGNLSVADFAKSAVSVRDLFYAICRSKVVDSRIRAQMTPLDFSMGWEQLQGIAAVLSDLPEDLSTLVEG